MLSCAISPPRACRGVRYKKSLPSRGGMKENGRNVKLRNFAATRLPRGGIKKSLPSRGGMKENDLLQRRNVKLRNFARFDFNTGIAHVSGFDHKPLAPVQLSGQLVNITTVSVLTLRIHNVPNAALCFFGHAAAGASPRYLRVDDNALQTVLNGGRTA